MRANGRSIRCSSGGKIKPRPIRVSVTRAAHRIASWGRCSADSRAEPAKVTTLKLQTRPAITRYGRAAGLLARVLSELPSGEPPTPEKNTTGSTGRMHGEMPVIRQPRNPIRATVCMDAIRKDRGQGRTARALVSRYKPTDVPGHGSLPA